MRQRIGFAMAIVLLLSGSAAFASEGGSLSLGFQGIGNIYANGRPTLRWKKSDATSFDVTPVFSYSDNGRTSGNDGTKISNYGAILGIVKHLKDVQGLRIGLVTNLGYTSGYEELDPRPNTATTFTYNNYTASIGIGPDFEYFLPVFPSISLGAQAIVQYQYAESTTKVTAGEGFRGMTDNFQSHSSTVNLEGEVFTARYYF